MSYRLKTMLGIAAIQLVLLMVLLFSSVSALRESVESELMQHAETTKRLFAISTKDAILTYDLASLESIMDELLTNKKVIYVRVVDSAGQVLAAKGLLESVPTPFAASVTVSEVEDRVFDAEVSISAGNVEFGTVQMGFDTARIEGFVATALRSGSSIALLQLLLVALFSWFAGVFLTRQLKELMRAARRVAHGDYSISLAVKGGDEVAMLSSAFNGMISALEVTDEAVKSSQKELEVLNLELEERVRRRTYQLQDSNDELRDINQQLQSTQKQLVQSEKLASIGQLAAGVAHEINNPVGFLASNLNTLQTYSQVYQSFVEMSLALSNDIGSGAGLDNEALRERIVNQGAQLRSLALKEDLDFINEDIGSLVKESLEGANRVTDIVAGLKSFSRQADDERKPESLNEAILNTLKLANNGIKYKCEVITEMGDVPKVCCNIGQMNQVILNLLVNATHAVDQGGKIIIRSGVDGQLAWFSVEDNGCGIDEMNLNRLFDPFFTTKPVGEGTGLGLSLSHGIICDHEGDIEVTSEPGKGSTFKVILPLQSSNECVAEAFDVSVAG